MKKILLATMGLVLGLSTLFGEETSTSTKPATTESLFYGDLGVGPLPFLVPSFGLGYRYQKDHFGADVALDLSTIYYATTLKITPAFLFYPSPNLASEFYVGLGADLGALFMKGRHWFSKDNTVGFVSPDVIFGKKYQNEAGKNRFFEARVSFPTFGFDKFKSRNFVHGNTIYYPIVYIKYGVEF